MDRGAWWATVHGVAKTRPRLGDFHFHLQITDEMWTPLKSPPVVETEKQIPLAPPFSLLCVLGGEADLCSGQMDFKA